MRCWFLVLWHLAACAQWPLLGARVRTAPACANRGRVLVAFGAHTDSGIVLSEFQRVVASAATFACPPHDVALFVDSSRDYKVLRHSLTVRVPFSRLVRNGTAAFRAFVSHQLLMAAVPLFLRNDKRYESVWVVEEDSKFAGGDWAQLFGAFNQTSADLVAHARKTNRGMASLMAVARVSARLFRAVRAELTNLEKKDAKDPSAMPTRARKTIHGAFIYGLCQRAKWCGFKPLDRDWLGIYRAKCPWSADMFQQLAPTWPAAAHGRIFHPVKVVVRASGRDFKRFRCKAQFEKEHVPKALYENNSKKKPQPHHPGLDGDLPNR